MKENMPKPTPGTDFDLDDLADEEVHTEYRGKQLVIRFDPDAYTPALDARVLANLPDGEQTMYWAKILAVILRGWNLTRNGEPVPLTEDAIAEVGVKLLRHIHREITRSIFPPATPETNSGSFS